MNKKASRQRRARKTRARIAEQRTVRLAIHRTNLHIYAQIISACGGKILASASSLDKDVAVDLANGGNKAAATVVGQRIAEKAKTAGISQVAFDRSGNRYHGRVKALAEAAREHGLQF
ncbi:MAG: 50S ribosomal protein L18 [Proteobacteria bacterium]|nr:50S ribosomal protein L18 [Pseudomonadota bacterium]